MQSRLTDIASQILTSYELVGGLNNTDGHNLPSKRALAGLCEQLLQFLFPPLQHQFLLEEQLLVYLYLLESLSLPERNYLVLPRVAHKQ